MKQEFISYNQASDLKDFGFDEECFAIYDEYKELIWNTKHSSLCYNSQGYSDMCTAPTYSQAFRWFRKKHGLDAEIMPYNFSRKEAKILGILKGKKYVFILDDDELPELKKINFFNTYEEAKQATNAIKSKPY